MPSRDGVCAQSRPSTTAGRAAEGRKNTTIRNKRQQNSVSKNRQQASGVEVAWIRVRVRVFHQQPFM